MRFQSSIKTVWQISYHGRGHTGLLIKLHQRISIFDDHIWMSTGKLDAPKKGIFVSVNSVKAQQHSFILVLDNFVLGGRVNLFALRSQFRNFLLDSHHTRSCLWKRLPIHQPIFVLYGACCRKLFARLMALEKKIRLPPLTWTLSQQGLLAFFHGFYLVTLLGE